VKECGVSIEKEILQAGSRDSVVECGSPLPLFLFSGRAKDLRPETLVGGGQIHRFMEPCDVSLEGNAAGL